MATKWKIDPAHSEIQFKVKHLMITTVTGYFKTFDLDVETETDDFNTAKKIEFTADIDSINTNNAQRDAHRCRQGDRRTARRRQHPLPDQHVPDRGS